MHSLNRIKDAPTVREALREMNLLYDKVHKVKQRGGFNLPELKCTEDLPKFPAKERSKLI